MCRRLLPAFTACYRTTRPHMLKRYRRMKKMKTSEGMTSAKPPANLYGSCELLSEASTCAGSVRCFTVRIVAAKTSFQDATKVKMAVAAIPGRESGNMMRQKAENGVQPSVKAASSKSRGI